MTGIQGQFSWEAVAQAFLVDCSLDFTVDLAWSLLPRWPTDKTIASSRTVVAWPMQLFMGTQPWPGVVAAGLSQHQ